MKFHVHLVVPARKSMITFERDGKKYNGLGSIMLRIINSILLRLRNDGAIRDAVYHVYFYNENMAFKISWTGNLFASEKEISQAENQIRSALNDFIKKSSSAASGSVQIGIFDKVMNLLTNNIKQQRIHANTAESERKDIMLLAMNTNKVAFPATYEEAERLISSYSENLPELSVFFLEDLSCSTRVFPAVFQTKHTGQSLIFLERNIMFNYLSESKYAAKGHRFVGSSALIYDELKKVSKASSSHFNIP